MPNPEAPRFSRRDFLAAVGATAIGIVAGVSGDSRPAHAQGASQVVGAEGAQFAPGSDPAAMAEKFYDVPQAIGGESRFVTAEGGVAPTAEKIYEANASGAVGFPLQDVLRGQSTDIPWQDQTITRTVSIDNPRALQAPSPDGKLLGATIVDPGSIVIGSDTTVITATFENPGAGMGYIYGVPDAPGKVMAGMEVAKDGKISLKVWQGSFSDKDAKKYPAGQIADYTGEGTFDVGIMIGDNGKQFQSVSPDGTISDPVSVGEEGVSSGDRVTAWQFAEGTGRIAKVSVAEIKG